MTTRSPSDLVGRRLWATGTVFAIAAALVAAVFLTSAPAPARASVDQTAATLDTALTSDPPATADRAKLKADLKAARKLEGPARAAALKKIRAGAASGAYGDKVEKRSDRRADRKDAVLALLPDELRADLEAVKQADKGDRRAMREDVRAKALAGDYGDAVKAAAEKLRKYWDE